MKKQYYTTLKRTTEDIVSLIIEANSEKEARKYYQDHEKEVDYLLINVDDPNTKFVTSTKISLLPDGLSFNEINPEVEARADVMCKADDDYYRIIVYGKSIDHLYIDPDVLTFKEAAERIRNLAHSSTTNFKPWNRGLVNLKLNFNLDVNNPNSKFYDEWQEIRDAIGNNQTLLIFTED